MRDHQLHRFLMEFFYFYRMQNIQTLIFDFGGVIINIKSEPDWLQQDLLPHFRREPLLQLYEAGYFNDLETGRLLPQEFLHKMQSIALQEDVGEMWVKQHWNAILKDIPAYRVDLLRRLRQKYRLILLSNTNAIHVESFQQYMHQTFKEDILQTNFHTVYYSQEIGMRKPGREIYEYVLQQQGIRPEETIFFDDRPENLTEPQKLGLQTYQVNFNKLSINDLQHLL